MAEFTERHMLRKPDYIDTVNPLLDVNSNLELIDALINFGPVTSSTRPENPKAGDLIYEEDTGHVLVYSSNQWIVLANNKFPKGKKGLTTNITTGSTVSDTSTSIHLSCTFSAEAGRKYMVESLMNIEFVSGPGAGVSADMGYIWASGGAVTTADTLLQNWMANVPGSAGTIRPFYKFIEFFPNITGNVTIGLIVGRSSATGSWRRHGTSLRKNYLLVRDWGV